MIEILCTLAGVIAGVAGCASLMHFKGDRDKFETKQQEGINPERIRGIADQLQAISARVAANVSAHSETVGGMSERLSDGDDDQASELIISTITDIVSANQHMQNQLQDAQKRIAQQSQLIEKASQQARTDALTGLCNRRALDEFVSNCVESMPEEATDSMGLLLMDVDHFKSFNDSFGHTTGDAVLASFARALETACNQECYTSRFGGEEFAVVLSADTPEQLAEKAAKVRRYVSEQVISYEDLQLKITASAGVSIMAKDDELATIYERADEGLYKSKKDGRDRGHWMSDKGLVPFPDVPGEVLCSQKPLKGLPKAVEIAEESAPPEEAEELEAAANPPEATEPETPAEEQPVPESKIAPLDESETASDSVEILDLNTFLGRLRAYLDQLRRAELPASGIMVEAIGMDNGSQDDINTGWEATVALIQLSLRGIDVVCLYKANTLCVFMPGCSPDSAMERVASIIESLENVRDSWVTGTCPERLAIAVAAITNNEEAPQYLDRLEGSLNEARDREMNEIVIHDGDSSYVQEV